MHQAQQYWNGSLVFFHPEQPGNLLQMAAHCPVPQGALSIAPRSHLEDSGSLAVFPPMPVFRPADAHVSRPPRRDGRVLTGRFACWHFRVKGEESRTQRRRPGAAPPASRRSTCHQHPDRNTPLPIRPNPLIKQRRLILPIRRSTIAFPA